MSDHDERYNEFTVWVQDRLSLQWTRVTMDDGHPISYSHHSQAVILARDMLALMHYRVQIRRNGKAFRTFHGAYEETKT